MSLPLPLRFKGAPGSPYTRKMLALLRYRRIPYALLIGSQAQAAGLPAPRVALLPTFYLPNAQGETEALVDSTPLIRRFEREFPERPVVPADPALAFLDYLIEDYADEWLTKAMFHYRWRFAPDIEQAGTILPLWTNLCASDARHASLSRQIRARQIERLHVVGSNETTAPIIEASYRRLLGILDRLLQQRPFVMGERPGASDFGVYAQLTQLAKFDPTPAAICLRDAPRVVAWTDLMDDLSGLAPPPDGWLTRENAARALGALLAEIGRVYAPVLLANARALHSSKTKAGPGAAFETTVDGKAWTQPVFPYQGKCLAALRREFAALDADAARAVRHILDGSGCEALLTEVA